MDSFLEKIEPQLGRDGSVGEVDRKGRKEGQGRKATLQEGPVGLYSITNENRFLLYSSDQVFLPHLLIGRLPSQRIPFFKPVKGRINLFFSCIEDRGGKIEGGRDLGSQYVKRGDACHWFS